MNALRSIVLVALTTFISASPLYAAPTERAQLIEMLKSLAILLEKGDKCGQYLNQFGKRGIESPACLQFTEAFYLKWPSRETLDNLLDDYEQRHKLKEFDCSNCDSMIERSKELRTLVVYYLDYIDFLKNEIESSPPPESEPVSSGHPSNAPEAG